MIKVAPVQPREGREMADIDPEPEPEPKEWARIWPVVTEAINFLRRFHSLPDIACLYRGGGDLEQKKRFVNDFRFGRRSQQRLNTYHLDFAFNILGLLSKISGAKKLNKFY